jgi:hypothetical protein
MVGRGVYIHTRRKAKGRGRGVPNATLNEASKSLTNLRDCKKKAVRRFFLSFKQRFGAIVSHLWGMAPGEPKASKNSMSLQLSETSNGAEGLLLGDTLLVGHPLPPFGRFVVPVGEPLLYSITSGL